MDHKSHAMAMQAWNYLGDWLTPKGSLRGTVPPQLPATLDRLEWMWRVGLERSPPAAGAPARRRVSLGARAAGANPPAGARAGG